MGDLSLKSFGIVKHGDVNEPKMVDLKDVPYGIHWNDHAEHIIYMGNYNDLTATSLEIMVNKGNHPQMALIQVSEIL